MLDRADTRGPNTVLVVLGTGDVNGDCCASYLEVLLLPLVNNFFNFLTLDLDLTPVGSPKFEVSEGLGDGSGLAGN